MEQGEKGRNSEIKGQRERERENKYGGKNEITYEVDTNPLKPSGYCMSHLP